MSDACGVQGFGADKTLIRGGFTPPQQIKSSGSPRNLFRGAQVRLPIDQLKAYIEEKIAF